MVKVWQSEVVEHNLNPKWHEAKIPMSTLCSGDLDKEIKIELWDLSADGSSLAMGSASTTVKAMLSNPELLIDIIKEHKVGIGSYKNSGSLKISGACIEENYQFGDVSVLLDLYYSYVK